MYKCGPSTVPFLLQEEELKTQQNAEDVNHLPDTDIDLEKLLLSRYNTRIGRFGAFHTPKYLKQVRMNPSWEEVSLFSSRLIVITAVIPLKKSINPRRPWVPRTYLLDYIWTR
jgi:hypothetical protein